MKLSYLSRQLRENNPPFSTIHINCFVRRRVVVYFGGQPIPSYRYTIEMKFIRLNGSMLIATFTELDLNRVEWEVLGTIIRDNYNIRCLSLYDERDINDISIPVPTVIREFYDRVSANSTMRQLVLKFGRGIHLLFDLR